ncbi:helix-hairpin-helix domain-containing protein [Aliiglaciecola aliphaticivorans]
MTKQRDPRTTFTSEGLRGDAIYALRKALKHEDIEEGEFLSQLFEKAVLDIHGGAGKLQLEFYKDDYQRLLDREPD